MLFRTHIRIAKKIAVQLALNSEQTECLVKGSLRPDYWKDHPHHHGKKSQIRQYIAYSRKFYLENAVPESLFYLGIALHYIQDSWVTLPGWHEQHKWYEAEVDREQFIEDLLKLAEETDVSDLWRNVSYDNFEECRVHFYEIAVQLKKFEQLCRSSFRTCTGEFIEEKTLEIATLERPKLGSPALDLNFAYKISFLVAASVYTTKISQTLQERLTGLRNKYRAKLEIVEEILARELFELHSRSAELEKKRGIINWLRRLMCNSKLRTCQRDYEDRIHSTDIELSKKVY